MNGRAAYLDTSAFVKLMVSERSRRRCVPDSVVGQTERRPPSFAQSQCVPYVAPEMIISLGGLVGLLAGSGLSALTSRCSTMLPTSNPSNCVPWTRSTSQQLWRLVRTSGSS